MNDKRIRQIIREVIDGEVDAKEFFDGINRSNGGLTPWSEHPSSREDRFRPGNASRAPYIAPDEHKFDVMRGHNDWLNNYSDRMDYSEYRKLFNLSR